MIVFFNKDQPPPKTRGSLPPPGRVPSQPPPRTREPLLPPGRVPTQPPPRTRAEFALNDDLIIGLGDI